MYRCCERTLELDEDLACFILELVKWYQGFRHGKIKICTERKNEIRAAIYCRGSTDHDEQDESSEAQEHHDSQMIRQQRGREHQLFYEIYTYKAFVVQS